MRLWYQSVTREAAFPSYRTTLQGLLDLANSPGTEIKVQGIERQGDIGDQYRYLVVLETVEILENVHKAQTQSFDGAATQALLKRFENAAEETVVAGAEVVVAAGGVVMAIVADQGMNATTSGAPNLNGVAALVQQGESAVRLRSLMGGNLTSGQSMYARPTSDVI